MKILVLNGSPRPHGDTAGMVAAFKEAAEQAGHEVAALDVCRMNIKGCLACECCHGKGHGTCAQKDDMLRIYDLLADANMLVLASPIYYHGISGQLKCAIDRFYSALYQQDKINYLVLGDLCPHLHIHLVPKYEGGKSWGTIFEMMPEPPKFLSAEDEAKEIEKIRAALT